MTVTSSPANPCGRGCHVNKSPSRVHIFDRLDIIDPHGDERERIEIFLDWLLYGLGFHTQKTLPAKLSKKAIIPFGILLLCQFFEPAVAAFPCDYWGDVLAESNFGRKPGFYPTPYTVCELMARMLMMSGEPTETVCDPCLGTERLPLYDSNMSVSGSVRRRH